MKQTGYTLIEIVMALGIVAFVVMAVIGIQLIVKESQSFSLNTLLTVDHGNGVVTQIARTLRNGRSADNGAFVLETLNDQEVIFYGNSDDDPQTERIHYFLEGASLKRGVIEPTGFPIEYPAGNEKVQVLTEYVVNGDVPIFYYYNGDYPADQTNNPLAPDLRLSQTRFVRIVVTVNADPDNPQGTYQLESFAQIRNLKTNL